VLAHPPDRIGGVHATELGDARQRGAGAADTAAACNLDATTSGGEAVSFFEGGVGVVPVQRQPEVRPAEPATWPWRWCGWLAEEVEAPLRVGPGWLAGA
jgi:hypothetical protein